MSATDRWNTLSTFVQTVCEGRDESHGHVHIKTVAETARKIVEKDFGEHPNVKQLLMDAITVAWLHDVSDHKYDHDGQSDKLLDEFGYCNIPNFDQIKKVVKLISYSSENRAILAGTPLNNEELLESILQQSGTLLAMQTNWKQLERLALTDASSTPNTAIQEAQRRKLSERSKNMLTKNCCALRMSSSEPQQANFWLLHYMRKW